ncbi:hypothetical protein M2103_000628 [Ereboglobus sp. PH5-5]|uniref:rhomboid family intramembrane serine protease n=1 Tax=Ereboglobus sp. PH5-5 TaxID=2940529 RepID=UPI002406CD56|nr:rhomboid family intramembrane serine protease [Ereboglobus sp. PH5-5]MDF9832418.1 hypothetical protein [Ereboglobus sp. PH5-5]
MSWLNRIERRLEPFAIPHLTLIIVAGQLLMLVAIRFLGIFAWEDCVLMPAAVLRGEWWRLITFAFFPPTFSPFWAAFALYMIYLFGSALEHYWGEVRFNLFLLCGYVLTVGVAFITPNAIATNIFISGSLFLAFAYLNPEFEIMVFFILPVKIKWLALITWIGYAFTFFTGGLSAKLMVVASVGNFLIFFSGDLARRIRSGRRRMATQADRIAQQSDTPMMRNRCHVCGKTSQTHPQEDFRYCSKCEGEYCYCSEHIRNHEHVRAPKTPGRDEKE